jgi:hypothetical protein
MERLSVGVGAVSFIRPSLLMPRVPRDNLAAAFPVLDAAAFKLGARGLLDNGRYGSRIASLMVCKQA